MNLVLIRNAEIAGHLRDVQLGNGQILAISPPGPHPPATAQDCVLDAQGDALLPGLHDHHIHLMALAAARRSVACGPPEVRTESALREQLRSAATRAPGSWLRGIGYHESVAGDIDRHWLDAVVPERPVRIQHRSGRLWVLNSVALASLPSRPSSPLERKAGALTGRLYDADTWLRQQLAGRYPPLNEICLELAGYGLTGVTDASVSNDRTTFDHLCDEARAGRIPQALNVMGDSTLSGAPCILRTEVGAFKIHLHEHALPDLPSTARAVAAAHDAGRAAAFHCVTESDLVYALAVLEDSGPLAGDRIEHAAAVSEDLLRMVTDRGLTVVTQPHFILERGDQYRRDIPPTEQSSLYRCAAWHNAGAALAAGSDAPYGSANPWIAMQAAIDRRTRDGHVLGPEESLSPEQALEMYLSPPRAPGRQARKVTVGVAADLCLLDRPWSAARADLAAVRVRATLCNGRLITSPCAFQDVKNPIKTR